MTKFLRSVGQTSNHFFEMGVQKTLECELCQIIAAMERLNVTQLESDPIGYIYGIY